MKLTYANVVSTLALIVAVSTGGALAVSKLITGRQIKDHTVGRVDLKPHTLTAGQIRRQSLTAALFAPGQLPEVPSKVAAAGHADSADRAANADAVGGVAVDGLLRTDHLVQGTAPATTSGGATILTDTRTGIKVTTGTSYGLDVTNTGSDTAYLRGIGFFTVGNLYGVARTIAPGGSTHVTFDATGFQYATFAILVGGRTLSLQCSESTDTLGCVAVS